MADPRNSSQVSTMPAKATPSADRITVPPPPQLNWLVECLRAEATLTLIEKAGGTDTYVPMFVGASNKTSPVAVLDAFNSRFGAELAKELIRYFGGTTIHVPTAQRWRTILYAEQGMLINDIAYKLGCSCKTVGRRLREHRQETGQRAGGSPPRPRAKFPVVVS